MMGTNYYLYPQPACPHCGREYELLHIGKSSAGWCFALHVIPGEINTLDDWIVRWKAPGAVIKDEYQRELTPEEMYAVITQRSWKSTGVPAAFLEVNHAELGPNGLLRHRLMSGHCTGHGDGTWDHVIGVFA